MTITPLTLAVILIPVIVEGRYIYSILRGKTKPSFVAFSIFTLEMTLILASSYSLGSRESLVLIASFTVLHGMTAVLALRYGYIHFTRFNLICVIVSLLGAGLWFLTDNAWYALLLNILVDSLGYMVLTRKLYLHPNTEDVYTWGMSVIAYALNLTLITRWVPEEYLFTIINIAWCSVILTFALRTKSGAQSVAISYH